MSKMSTFLFGLLIGGILGWVMGILSAPQPGQDTRSAVTQKAAKLRREAGQAAGQARNRTRRP